MKPISIADIVFFMMSITLCYTVIFGLQISPEFLTIAGTVVGSFYTHKAQTKNNDLQQK